MFPLPASVTCVCKLDNSISFVHFLERETLFNDSILQSNWSCTRRNEIGSFKLLHSSSKNAILNLRIKACDRNDNNISHSHQSGARLRNFSSKLWKKKKQSNNFLSSPGLANALQCVQKDANILIQEFCRLDSRARQDVAFLGSQFVSIDEKARQDCLCLDQNARLKVEKLAKIAANVEECAKSELRNAAAHHWNDGKLEEDLRLGDLRARRRVLEDSYSLFQFVCYIQEAVFSVKQLCLRAPLSYPSSNQSILENRQKFPIDSISPTCFTSLAQQPWQEQQQEQKQTIGRGIGIEPMLGQDLEKERIKSWEASYSVLLQCLGNSDEEEGEIDFSDSEELELIASTLLDLEEVTSAGGASFVFQCANSPDVETRRAIAKALSAAPSLCSLGNAGIGALQRLSQDSNEAVAEAASMALRDLELRWDEGAPYSHLLFFPKFPQTPEMSLNEDDLLLNDEKPYSDHPEE